MPFHSHRGFDQFYELKGSGPDLVWAHGLYMSSAKDEAFFGFFPRLASQWRMLTFDARGHGRSSFTTDPADYTWDSLATDLEQLLDHVGFGRAAFIGGSMGSITCLTLAARQPERIRAMVLFQPTCIGQDVQKVGRAAKMMIKVIERQGMSAAAELILGMGPWASLALTDPGRVAALREGFADQQVEAVKAASLGVTTPPGWDAERLEHLRDLKIPILLIADPDDASHPRASAEQLHAVLPDSHLVVAPHNFYFFAHRDELERLMLDFLSVRGDLAG